MRERNDILLDENADLLAVKGDFATGEDLLQRQMLLLSTGEGEWKQSPITGVNVYMYLFSNSELELRRKVKQQFKNDEIQLVLFDRQNNEIKTYSEYA